jgi:hypothetical protein
MPHWVRIAKGERVSAPLGSVPGLEGLPLGGASDDGQSQTTYARLFPIQE